MGIEVAWGSCSSSGPLTRIENTVAARSAGALGGVARERRASKRRGGAKRKRCVPGGSRETARSAGGQRKSRSGGAARAPAELEEEDDYRGCFAIKEKFRGWDVN